MSLLFETSTMCQTELGLQPFPEQIGINMKFLQLHSHDQNEGGKIH